MLQFFGTESKCINESINSRLRQRELFLIITLLFGFDWGKLLWHDFLEFFDDVLVVFKEIFGVFCRQVGFQFL